MRARGGIRVDLDGQSRVWPSALFYTYIYLSAVTRFPRDKILLYIYIREASAHDDVCVSCLSYKM